LSDPWRDLMRPFENVQPSTDLLPGILKREAALPARRVHPRLARTVTWLLAGVGCVLVVAALALAAHSRGKTSAGSAPAVTPNPPSLTCHPSIVHYDKNPAFPLNLRPLPYVQASAHGFTLVGHLFYYTAVPAWKGHHITHFRIFPHGQMGNSSLQMKILWTLLDGSPSTTGLTVNGVRTDTGTHLSTQRFAGGTEFPSIIDVPTAGCWRLSLSTGTSTTHLTVLAVKPTP
jgi:hypothetical protein